MQNQYETSTKKGRLTLSVSQNLLNRLEPYKHQINISAQTELMLEQLLAKIENRTWVERNAGALVAHGKDIASTGLAGTEFERI